LRSAHLKGAGLPGHKDTPVRPPHRQSLANLPPSVGAITADRTGATLSEWAIGAGPEPVTEPAWRDTRRRYRVPKPGQASRETLDRTGLLAEIGPRNVVAPDSRLDVSFELALQRGRQVLSELKNHETPNNDESTS
jgi:hypothetical protein